MKNNVYSNTTKLIGNVKNNISPHSNGIIAPVIEAVFNETILRRFSTSIYFSMNIYDIWKLIEPLLLTHHNGVMAVIYNRYKRVNAKIESIDDAKLSSNIPSTDKSFLCIDRRTICVIKYIRISGEDSIEQIHIQFIGKNAYVYMKRVLYHIRKYKYNSFSSSNSIFIDVLDNNNQVINYQLCDFKDVILDDMENKIIRPLNNFLDAVDIYKQYSVTYKEGILLYGSPGTGKSTLIRAIIQHIMERDISVLPVLLKLNTPISELEGNIQKILNKSQVSFVMGVIIMEEIDSVFPRDRDEIDNETLAKINLLLQFLDGPLSPSNTIFIATTNYIDKLDPAIKRDGRFNIEVEMKGFHKKEAIKMCDKFGVRLEDLEDISMGDDDTIIPATLQKHIFNHVMKQRSAY